MNLVQTHVHHGAAHREADVPARPGTLRQVAIVTGRTVAERWRSLLVWSLGLVGITAIELAVYPSIQSTSEGWRAMLDQWPDALKEAFRLDAYASGTGFLNTELFSMMFPIVLIAVAIGIAASATAGEEERGTADLLLSLPIRRGQVLSAKVLALVVCVVVVGLAGVLTIVIGAPMVDLDVGTSEAVRVVRAPRRRAHRPPRRGARRRHRAGHRGVPAAGAGPDGRLARAVAEGIAVLLGDALRPAPQRLRRRLHHPAGGGLRRAARGHGRRVPPPRRRRQVTACHVC